MLRGTVAPDKAKKDGVDPKDERKADGAIDSRRSTATPRRPARPQHSVPQTNTGAANRRIGRVSEGEATAYR